MHDRKTDHLFVVAGHLQAVLYDDRDGSPTRGKLDVLHLSPMRPTLLVIPPHVWHGLQNLEATTSTFVNYFDEQYAYDNPDDWRLPADTERSPTASDERPVPADAVDRQRRFAARADAAGVDRIGVDLDRLGKRDRQAGLGSSISPHTEDDLVRVGAGCVARSASCASTR